MDELIRELEKAQDMIYKGKISEAKTAVYAAECMAIFIRDNKS